jgi:hypothetical protein
MAKLDYHPAFRQAKPSTAGVNNLAYALSLAYTHTIAYLWSAYYVKYTAVILRGTEVENVSFTDV